MMATYDLVIVGGGAGAFAAAIRADELGAKTALVNSGLPLGGTCVNVGCVPSKALLWAGEIAHAARHHGVPGIEIDAPRVDFASIVRDELALVDRLRAEKYEHVLAGLRRVTHIEGKGRFVSPREIEVNGGRVKGAKFIIATGSTATVPPIDGLATAGFITHIEALRLERPPATLLVIGAGALGLEFAQLFARFGTQVTVLQRGATVFPRTEPRLAQRLMEVLARENITVVTDAAVRSVECRGGRKRASYEADGATRGIVVDEILLAAGKTPNTSGLGLRSAGVRSDGRGAIRVDSTFRTSEPDIFAVGDVAALPMRLEITAAREGTLAAENALQRSARTLDYDTVPYTVFTDPQLAGAGLTEDAQLQRLGACECRTLSFEAVPKAIIMRRTEGLIKMTVHPQTKQVMGVHILAPQAGELAAQAALIVGRGLTLHEVADSLPMFPTLSEAIKLVAMSFTHDVSKMSCCV